MWGINDFDEVYELPRLTSGFNPAVAEAGRIRVHAREPGQFCSQIIAGVEQCRAGTGGAVGATRPRRLRKAGVAQFHSNLFRRQAEHLGCDLGQNGVSPRTDVGHRHAHDGRTIRSEPHVRL